MIFHKSNKINDLSNNRIKDIEDNITDLSNNRIKNIEDGLSVYYKYYSKDDEIKYNVVAIELEKID